MYFRYDYRNIAVASPNKISAKRHTSSVLFILYLNVGDKVSYLNRFYLERILSSNENVLTLIDDEAFLYSKFVPI